MSSPPDTSLPQQAAVESTPRDAAQQYWQAAVGPALRSALIELSRLSPKPENPVLFLGEALAQQARSRGAQPSEDRAKDAGTPLEAAPSQQHGVADSDAELLSATAAPSEAQLGPTLDYRSERLAIFVFGASGDLAKKKTYPALFTLYTSGLLPARFAIYGFARSVMTDEHFREKLRASLPDARGERSDKADAFLAACHYRAAASYADLDAARAMAEEVTAFEARGEVLVQHATYSSQHTTCKHDGQS